MLGYLDYLIYFWLFFYISGSHPLALLLVLFWKGNLPARVYNVVDFGFPKDNPIVRGTRGIITCGISCGFCGFALIAILFVVGFAIYAGLANFGKMDEFVLQFLFAIYVRLINFGKMDKYSIITVAALLLSFMAFVVLGSTCGFFSKVRRKFEKRLENKLKEPLYQKNEDIRCNIFQTNDRIDAIQKQHEMIKTHAGETRKDLASSQMLFKIGQVHANYRNLGSEHSGLEKQKKKLIEEAHDCEHAIDSVNQTVDNTSLWKLIRT